MNVVIFDPFPFGKRYIQVKSVYCSYESIQISSIGLGRPFYGVRDETGYLEIVDPNETKVTVSSWIAKALEEIGIDFKQYPRKRKWNENGYRWNDHLMLDPSLFNFVYNLIETDEEQFFILDLDRFLLGEEQKYDQFREAPCLVCPVRTDDVFLAGIEKYSGRIILRDTFPKMTRSTVYMRDYTPEEKLSAAYFAKMPPLEELWSSAQFTAV